MRLRGRHRRRGGRRPGGGTRSGLRAVRRGHRAGPRRVPARRGAARRLPCQHRQPRARQGGPRAADVRDRVTGERRSAPLHAADDDRAEVCARGGPARCRTSRSRGREPARRVAGAVRPAPAPSRADARRTDWSLVAVPSDRDRSRGRTRDRHARCAGGRTRSRLRPGGRRLVAEDATRLGGRLCRRGRGLRPRSARYASRRRGRVRRRSIRIDAGYVDCGGAQCPAAVPARHDDRLLLQHRRFRVHVRAAVSREPRVRRVEPGDRDTVRRATPGRSRGDRDPAVAGRSCSASRRGRACRARWWC